MAQTTNQALTDGIVSRLKVQSGSTVFSDAFGLDHRANDDLWVTDAASALTGLYWVPLSPDQTLGGAIDARQLAQISAVLDQNNPGGASDQYLIGVRDVLYAEDMGLTPTS
jgi:hypothetical protein